MSDEAGFAPSETSSSMVVDGRLDAATMQQTFTKQGGWGFTACIDLFECTHDKLKSEKFVEQFLRDLTAHIDMKPYGEPQVHRFGDGDLEGVSGVQLIMTSNITIHCDEVGNRAFITIESCSSFDPHKAEVFCADKFGAKEKRLAVLFRGAM